MANKLTHLGVALAISGALVVVVGGASCDDDNNNAASTGGTTGSAGTGGTTGNAGTSGNTATYNMMLTGANEVPANTSAATANVTVMLNKTTGALTVTGNFQGLTSNATVAHIHGPAAVGVNGPVLVPLTISTPAKSGTVSANATMTAPAMNDMLNGMTYVNIHSEMFPDGEIRAQIVP
jgi:hypothetical protein